jgi:hypothetical protein
LNELFVGLSAWIIQDGNYPDFAAGDVSAFALEFFSEAGLSQTSSRTSSLRWKHDSIYEAVGRVVHADTHWWALDFGVLMYREDEPPQGAEVGQWWSGSIYVGIDPFFYFERLALQPSAPSMIYDWTIESIQMETTPTVEIAPRMEPLTRKSVPRTHAWTDNSGYGDYLLQCRRLLDHPPRRTLGRD